MGCQFYFHCQVILFCIPSGKGEIQRPSHTLTLYIYIYILSLSLSFFLSFLLSFSPYLAHKFKAALMRFVTCNIFPLLSIYLTSLSSVYIFLCFVFFIDTFDSWSFSSSLLCCLSIFPVKMKNDFAMLAAGIFVTLGLLQLFSSKLIIGTARKGKRACIYNDDEPIVVCLCVYICIYIYMCVCVCVC